MSLSDIRKNLRQAIKDERPDLNVYAEAESGVDLSGGGAVVILPSVDRDTPAIDYELDFGDGQTYHFDLFVLTTFEDMPSGQRRLDKLIDKTEQGSIPYILKRNKRLFNTVDSVRVMNATDYGGNYEYADIKSIGAKVKIRVVKSCA